MKVLIITYYWPPAGGSGVQRWLKFVKYLQDFGIEPVVYCPENTKYASFDETLLNEIPKGVEVLKLPIKNPQDYISFFKKKQKSGIANISKGGFLSWIRGNFFIPDAKLFWVKPSVKYLEKYLKEHPVDVVVSSGPPHSMHLIASALKRKLNLKWIADFRDPWTNLYYAEGFKLSRIAKRKNKQLETAVLEAADLVLTVSNTLKEEFLQVSKKVKVITNGYDDEVLENDNILLDSKFSIAHIGLLPIQSNPKNLWHVLQEICDENDSFSKDLEICLTGDVNGDTLNDLKSYNLLENTKLNGYVSHKEAIQLQKQAQVLLLVLPNTVKSKGILTGKLFEYLTAERPILAIGIKEGDLAKIIKDTKAGELFDFSAKEKLKEFVLKLYSDYKTGKLIAKSENVAQYHRKELTKKLATLIKEL